MRITFTADESCFEADEDTLTCGVAGGGRYLTLQRDAEGADEDWGIHLEFDDHSNGDYECVGACRIGHESLSIDLSQPLGTLAGVTGFDVALRLTPEQMGAIRHGLRQVFRGQLNLLTFTDASAATHPETS